MTFSYTSAFWDWDQWQLELDWLALRGVNLPLAWVGQERHLVDTFRGLNLTDEDILSYFSGPAFQAWHRFGNIRGSWGGQIPESFFDNQYNLQKLIVQRMVDLGMKPVLPAFTGFVPDGFWNTFPDAKLVNGSQWEKFPSKYTNVTFLSPDDELFSQIQTDFMQRQIAAYGNVTNIWTLDQYNENDPFSGDLDYLGNVTYHTWQSMKAADPQAVWMMQGWLFYSSKDFWTEDRIKAYLGGVQNDEDMLILDLFSESQPQWQRTKSYYGKPWIWCQLHNYGGNMGLYGQVENVTVNAINALAESESLVGFGLTPEAQEGNEIMYDLLLDQAWSKTAIDTEIYFHDWVTTRYSSKAVSCPPTSLYEAWDILRTSAYNNTNLTATSVTKSILELEPKISGMLGRVGHHPTVLTYDSSFVEQAWKAMAAAGAEQPHLWTDAAYQYDLVDVTRQVLSNKFMAAYTTLVTTYNQTNETNPQSMNNAATEMRGLLTDLDMVLSTNKHFSLSTWIDSARAMANSTNEVEYFEYNARNQITLWGPDGEISDYASKSWGGLVSGYYLPRWNIFSQYLTSVPLKNYNATALHQQLLAFELAWQEQKSDESNKYEETNKNLEQTVQTLLVKWL